MNWKTARPIAVLGLLAIVVAAGSGCSALPKFSDMLAEDKSPPPSDAIPPDQATIKLQVSQKDDEVQRVRIPLRNGALVGDILVKAGLTKKFADMDITVLRSLPDGKQIKLEIRYDRGKRQVEPSYNYALLPDDLIVVNEISRSMLDDVLDHLSDPLVARYRRT
jgi:hypothetical protein